ncbi:hypothetical protein FA95DRAFT_1557762 [Auriscalpium vulgare]|uniref:Uncharacterized protein n=1 Tax=Auriscalpium vulgare TaxID=40419 RepID=A0ACB8RXZ1_9AGAM|nr:hypothetical protein FA95DRAFT_1557762 [Auriscalpium vulgare]
MSPSIIGLPNELLGDILGRLDCKSILAFQTTCRQFKTFVDSAPELQCTIKLDALALCEGPDAHRLGVSERLQRLQAYEAAQATDVIKLEELPFVPSLGNSDGRLFTSVTTLVSEEHMDDGLRVYVQQMPSMARGIEERHWSLWFSDHNYTIGAVDASQDLLVMKSDNDELGDVMVRMLTLSTGERHPLTAWDTGMAMPWNEDEIDQCHNIEVFGDYCAAKCVSWEAEIFSVHIWHWKMWTKLAKIVPMQLDSNFAFLNDAYIAVVSEELQAILVYGFRSWNSEERITFKLSSREPLELLMLPCDGVSGAAHAGVFHPIPSARMLSVRITLFTPRDIEHELLLMIPVDTLLAHILRRRHTHTVEVPWSSWGPSGSCMASYPWGLENSRGTTAMRLVVGTERDGFAVAALCVARARLSGTPRCLPWVNNKLLDEGEVLMHASLPCVVKEVVIPWPRGVEWPAFEILTCEDQLIVLEKEHEDQISVLKAWAATI